MNEENARMKKTEKPVKKGRHILSVFIALFCVGMLSVTLYGLLLPDREYSENENRVLTQKPVVTVHGLFDGSYMKDLESYLSDQFPFRDEAILMKSFFERVWGKKKENGAYIGKNGFLFDSQSAYDEEKTGGIITSVSSFAKKTTGMKKVFALVPNSSYIYAENLPSHLELESQRKQVVDFYKKLSDKVTCVDTFTPLIKAKENADVFYRTDHHWTTRGAFSVFEKIMSAYGIKVDKNDFEFHTVSNSFEGTLKSKSISQNSTDAVEICFPKNSQGTYIVDISGVDGKRTSCFFEEKLNEKNHYEVFFGGNYGKMTITTMSESGRELLVIKDSFANCMLPMLTPYFSKIVVLDPRYMTENVYGIIDESDFTDILFLYNANTLFEDSSLVSVL